MAPLRADVCKVLSTLPVLDLKIPISQGRCLSAPALFLCGGFRGLLNWWSAFHLSKKLQRGHAPRYLPGNFIPIEQAKSIDEVSRDGRVKNFANFSKSGALNHGPL